MGIMPELRWIVVDEGWVMYSERRFRNNLTATLSVGVGRTISRRVCLCKYARLRRDLASIITHSYEKHNH